MLEKTSEKELDYTQAYQNVYDADAAVIGIYGKFMSLAKRYIILNELRADLLDYTDNADKYLRQISNHTVTSDNPYASPRPFYELIINCNDVLKNFDIMRHENKLTLEEYNQRFSDVACLRSFLYLQLGIHYGDQVRYVTSPLTSIDDLKNTSLFPRVSFDALLDSLITFTEAIPYKDQYATGSTLNITLDGYPTAKFFITKKVLLGDLYLWKGSYDQAATYYRQVMEIGSDNSANPYQYCYYKLGWNTNDQTDHYITYTIAGSAPTLVVGAQWRRMFDQPATDQGFNWEWVWALPFDNKFSPVDSLIQLFSPTGGQYLVKPSQQIMDMWNTQVQKPIAIPSTINGLPYDARGQLSVRTIGGQRVAMKFLYKYLSYENNLPVDILKKDGSWFLFRQTQLHLRFAEAANQSGWHKLAYAFFNSGIPGVFDNPTATDKTLWQNTLNYPYPYNFDARNSGATGVPYFRGDWYRNLGIRSRANLQNYTIVGDSLTSVENGLIQEEALENAFEGTRWADLLRVARRRNDPSFLAEKVYQKLLKDGDPNAAAARSKLMSKDGWYLPFVL